MTQLLTVDRLEGVVQGRHDYAREWKRRTGSKVVGYFCSYVPEELIYAARALPVRILGSHEPQDVTEPYIFSNGCPFCRDCLALGAIFHVNRGCMGQAGGLSLERQALQREGIPNTFFEATHTDPRDVDVVQITERLDSFLESLGLKKLEVKEGGEEEVPE